MKKFILVLSVLSALSFTATAQKTIGAGLAYGSEIENLGIGVNAEFDLNDQIDISQISMEISLNTSRKVFLAFIENIP